LDQQYDIDPQYQDWVERLAARYQLGVIRTIEPPQKGFNNRIFIVNDAYAVRFNGLTDNLDSRFAAEKIAYDALHRLGLPAPRVIAVDQSRSIAPMDVLIMTKIPGGAVSDTWHTLSAAQQSTLAYEAGTILAKMHSIQLSGGFGYLYQLANNPFARWVDHVQDFADRYLARAEAQRTVEPALLERIRAVLIRHRPLLEAVQVGHLVHADAHWGNWLQQDGKITGLIDFEWARCGDPSSEFQIEQQLDEDCPGSHDPLMAGYTSIRPLDAAHPLRAAIYQLLRHFDSVVETKDSPEDTQYQAFFDQNLRRVLVALAVLEHA
jgi:aminoglycoside phosphotransferase (APT) family kinase protein